ncbi:MAG: TlpA family protein disulfide reductase [Acidimicrobiia bacterium]|nr:TlpA family protein disulfide reductase [Acidimicrobiia bacterium]
MTRSCRTRPFVLLAMIATVVAVAAAPATAKDAKTEISKKVVVAGAALEASPDVGTSADPAIGRKAPTLTGQGFDGKKVTIGGPGKPRAVIFLSHSCPHCQAEVPRIVKLAKQGKLDGIEVDTVTTNTSTDLPNYPPSKWLAREKWPFKTVLADDARLRGFFGYGGEAFPYFVLLDAQGKVAGRAAGEIESQAIADAAKNLAAGQPVFSAS